MNKIYKIKCAFLLTCSIVFGLAFLILSYFKISFPIAYNKEIKIACKEFSVDENLVRAVINVESGYNELAVSKVGARGLMQIMPATARWIADELEIENYNNDMLFNSEINIRMGVFYLDYLIEKYQEINLVLFAYNAGEGRLSEALTSEDMLVVENIVIGETKSYIKKVKRQQDIYKKFEQFY